MIDKIQNILLNKRRNTFDKYDSSNVSDALLSALKENIAISKTYLPIATGAFKEQVEQTIQRYENLIGVLTRNKELVEKYKKER